MVSCVLGYGLWVMGYGLLSTNIPNCVIPDPMAIGSVWNHEVLSVANRNAVAINLFIALRFPPTQLAPILSEGMTWSRGIK